MARKNVAEVVGLALLDAIERAAERAVRSAVGSVLQDSSQALGRVVQRIQYAQDQVDAPRKVYVDAELIEDSESVKH